MPIGKVDLDTLTDFSLEGKKVLASVALRSAFARKGNPYYWIYLLADSAITKQYKVRTYWKYHDQKTNKLIEGALQRTPDMPLCLGVLTRFKETVQSKLTAHPVNGRRNIIDSLSPSLQGLEAELVLVEETPTHNFEEPLMRRLTGTDPIPDDQARAVIPTRVGTFDVW